jgi:hypothetical protein
LQDKIQLFERKLKIYSQRKHWLSCSFTPTNSGLREMNIQMGRKLSTWQGFEGDMQDARSGEN